MAGTKKFPSFPASSITAGMCATLIVAALILTLSTTARASQVDQASGAQTAPVVIDGYELFRLSGISARPAEQRATEIAGRIKGIAADWSMSGKSLRTIKAQEQTRVLAADRLVMIITDADADVEGIPRQVLSELYLDKIRGVIERYRQERTPRVLLVNSAYAAGATLLLAVIVFVIIRVSRRLEQWIDNRYKAKLQGVRIQSFQLVQAEKFWHGVHGGLHAVRVIAIVLLCLVYAHYVCNLYPWTRLLAKRGGALLLDPLRTMAGGILAAIPNLAFIAVLILVLRYVLKLARLFFSGIENGTVTISGFDRDWALPTYKILRMLIIALGAVVAYPYVPGSQSDAFKGVSIFVGIVFSLGSTSAIANIIAGYMMTYRRAFKVGDRIKVMDLVGDVVEMRLQVTHLRSLKNEEIIVPNSQILSSHVINYTRLAKEHGLILHTTVGIGYETPWRQVEAMLLLAAERTPGLLREPPPFVLQTQLGDFCVTYEINVYCDAPAESLKLYTLLHRNILDVFNEFGVQIMTPAYEVDPEQAKVVPKEKWFEAPAKGFEIRDSKFESAKPGSGPEK
jgi:small-conductance mechanosensitive channel